MAHGKDSGSTHENSSNREAPNKQAMGGKRYRDRIARDSKTSGPPPVFEFVKPPRRYQAKKEKFHVCDFCFTVNMTSKDCAGIVCRGCTKFNKVHKDNSFFDEESLDSYMQKLGL